MSTHRETIVISVGGSLLIPEDIDVAFIKAFKAMINFFISENYQIVLAIGGGKTSRKYHKAAAHFDNVNDNDLDWIGISTIKLNAQLLYSVFSDISLYPDIIASPDHLKPFDEALAIVAAWEPGHSSDYNAVVLARELGARKVINFSNVSYVYDKDPALYPDAQAHKKLTWDEYLAIIPKEWSPNLSSPFDPIASRLAQDHGLQVAILGASIENLSAYLKGADFEGTTIDN